MQENFEITEKHFSTYKKSVKKYIRKFGLTDWQCSFFKEDIEHKRACVAINYAGKFASFKINTQWNTKPTKNDIKRSAYHEVIELLLYPLFATALDVEASRTQREQEFELQTLQLLDVWKT